MKLLNWQSFTNPNDINTAIAKQDKDWYSLKNAEQIVSITYDTNHNCYVVFWIVEEEENNVGIKESYGVEVQHVEK